MPEYDCTDTTPGSVRMAAAKSSSYSPTAGLLQLLPVDSIATVSQSRPMS